jgi:cytoskeletal protein CcmA (bactofilin family)
MMKVSARALSVPCPHCNRAISLENLRIIGSHPGRALATCGDIQIEATARLNLTVIGRNIKVQGRVRGPVSGFESVEVGPTGHVIGDITSPKIVVCDGAVIQGRCQMTRPPAVEAEPPAADGAGHGDATGPTILDTAGQKGGDAYSATSTPPVRPLPLRRPRLGT